MANTHCALKADGAKEQEGLVGFDEKREAPRVTVFLRTAKLLAEGHEFLCIIRDVSETGIRLELFHPLPRGSEFLLEAGNGDRYPIELVWSDGRFAGFRFEDRIDLCRFVAAPHGNLPKRPIRLRSSLEGRITLGTEPIYITFENISQQGACIECDRFLAIDQLVTLEADKIPAVQAKVRWRCKPRYGLIFEQTFRLEELARLLAP